MSTQKRFEDKVVIITGQQTCTVNRIFKIDKSFLVFRFKFGHLPRRGRGVREGGGIGGDPWPEPGQIGCGQMNFLIVIESSEYIDPIKETEKLILAAGVPANRILRVLGSFENREVADRILSETINRFGKLDVLVRCTIY